MSRRILSPEDVRILRGPPPAVNDDRGGNSTTTAQKKADAAREVHENRYVDKVLRLIPGEAVAFFVFVNSTAQAAQQAKMPIPDLVYWAVTAVVAVGAFFYSLHATDAGPNGQKTGPTGQKLRPAYLQAVLAVVSFGVWVFAIAGPLSWINPFIRGLVLPLYTFLVPIILPTATDTR